ncbi:MAG TPA: hypothetical protein PK760_10075, partial [Flavobacteriales bacterium]|nr:hypothetical protein [Flavobacteriales bacterium]
MRTIIAASVISLLAACGSAPQALKHDNQVGLYGKGTSTLRLGARVYHNTTSHSIIYYKLSSRDLLYKSDGNGTPFKAFARITYESYADWGSKQLLDSASTVIEDKTTDPEEVKELIGSMDLRRIEGKSFIVRVTARDLNRDNESSLVLRVDKDGKASRQYFMPTDTMNGLPYFDDHLMLGKSVRVRCEVLA